MRKHLILYIQLCCLLMATRGQTPLDELDLSGLPQPTQAAALRYWFDDDAGSVQTTSQLSGTQTLDVSGLAEGLHTLHYQVVDNTGATTYVRSALFVNVKSPAAPQAATLRYWFDDDASGARTTNGVSSAYSLDVSELVDGLHTLHYLVLDSGGSTYTIASSIFIKLTDNQDDEPVTARKLMYWYDDETDLKTIDMTGDIQTLDASALVDGLHTLHYQVVCSNGQMTSAMSSLFLRLSTSMEPRTAKSLRYWFDDGQTATEIAIIDGVQMLDASHLKDGLHTVHFQTIADDGTSGSPSSSIFLKMDSGTAVSATGLRYWFDNETAVRETSIAGGTQDIDVSELTTGLHTLYYQLSDSEGKVDIPTARVFFKDFDKQTVEGGNRVTKYQYWLNHNNEAMQTVELSDAPNPYTLIGLLPMQKEPIHSDCFQFEVTDGQPTVYAKNVFHVRFHDALGYFSDDEKQFVDYAVKQEVTDAEWLESGVRTTTTKPVNDAIKWYCLEAEPGDSLQFMLDRAATVQLFAPSGKEVFSVSGAEAVKWFGCHVWEEGTFYVALHDVTATYGSTISLDYNHIDKYAVLRQDVSVVGNGGFSTITFDGNGFRDLFAVDLFTEEGDTIKSSAIRHTSDAVVSVLFDFTDKRTCKYNAIFHFTLEDKRFQNIVTVEEAKVIELALDVKYPSTFLRGTSTTYTITITNKGNSTAYNVPMEIYLSADDSFANIESVRFIDELGKEFNNLTLDEIDKDSIDDESLNYIEGFLKGFNGLLPFIVKNDSVNGSNYGFTDQLITIPPNSSTTFYIEIASLSTVDLKVRIPSDWITVHSERDIAESRKGKNILDRDWCCEKEAWECLAEISFNIVGMVPIAGCISGALDMWFYDVFEIACTDGVDLKDKIDNFCFTFTQDAEKHKSYLQKGFINLISCLVGKIVEKIADLVKELIPLKNLQKAADTRHSNYYKQFTNKFNNAEWCKEEAEKALRNGNRDYYHSLMDSYDELMGEAKELEKLSKFYADQVRSYGEQITDIENKIDYWQKEIAKLIGAVNNAKNALSIKPECFKKWEKANADCRRDPKEKEGKSTPVAPRDPNDITGYTAESTCKAVKDGQTDVYYKIEFENDPEFATASAHDIYLTDTLDATKFDLSTFAPTRVKIGDKSAELSGDKNFVTTIDMRPGINAIAQVEGTYDQQNGIAKWHISSLDPMTMEPTTYLMDGVLPVNTDGRGIGEVWYDIKLKPNLAHGTEIDNRAGIVFDNNNVIMTPTWTNVIDRIAPESHVIDAKMLNDSTAAVSIAATDELSGPWRYNVYVQYGDGTWFIGAENVPIDKTASVKVFQGIDHGFYVVVTDSAGNVEQKEAQREYTFEVFAPQVETTTKLQLDEGWNWISQNQNTPLTAEVLKPKAQRILSQTEELYKDARFGWTGDLNELQPTQMYKVQTNGNGEIQLSGLLFNAAFRSVPLYEGWNWLGYPVAHTMTPTEALAKLEAEEGDALIGQDGLATFSDGQWTGTLTELVPGQGYLYRSTSTKNLFLNATAQASRRMVNQQKTIGNTDKPETWTVDKRKYPNIMGIVASLCENGEPVADAEEWLLGAFSGGECRGLAQTVGGQLMMNVYGQGGEAITFFVIHRESGEILAVSESMTFCTDLIGTVRQPFILNMSVLTGITDAQRNDRLNADHIYDLQGRRVDGNHGGKGVYIVTDENHSRTQKAVRR